MASPEANMVHFQDMELQLQLQLQTQPEDTNSHLANHRDARLSKAMTSATTNIDNSTAIPRLYGSPPPFDFTTANDAIIRHGVPDYNSSHSTINLQGASDTTSEVNDALQELSTCINQVINNNDKNSETKGANSRYRSARKQVDIRSML